MERVYAFFNNILVTVMVGCMLITTYLLWNDVSNPNVCNCRCSNVEEVDGPEYIFPKPKPLFEVPPLNVNGPM